VVRPPRDTVLAVEKVFGKHSVRAVLLTRPETVTRLVMAGKESYHHDLIELARGAGIEPERRRNVEGDQGRRCEHCGAQSQAGCARGKHGRRNGEEQRHFECRAGQRAHERPPQRSRHCWERQRGKPLGRDGNYSGQNDQIDRKQAPNGQRSGI
jgi:hypothetical protein